MWSEINLISTSCLAKKNRKELTVKTFESTSVSFQACGRICQGNTQRTKSDADFPQKESKLIKLSNIYRANVVRNVLEGAAQYCTRAVEKMLRICVFFSKK